MLLRIIFADDHDLVRQTITNLLRKNFAGRNIKVDQADSLDAVHSLAAVAPKPALIILDLSMPGMNGPVGIESVRATLIDVPIIILSGFTEAETIEECFKKGADGFIPKGASPDEFCHAISVVLDGHKYVPLAALDKTHNDEKLWGARGTRHEAELLKNLTDREKSILSLVAQGMKNKEIARAHSVEETTVKMALRRIYRKLNVINRAAAANLFALNNYPC